jgi:hypothetical protein
MHQDNFYSPDWWETWAEDNLRKKLVKWNKEHQESKVVINVPEVVAKIKNVVLVPVLRIIP